MPTSLQGQVDVTDIYFSESEQESEAPGDTTIQNDNQTDRFSRFDRPELIHFMWSANSKTLQIDAITGIALEKIEIIGLSGQSQALRLASTKTYKRTLTEFPSGYYVVKVQTSAGWLHKNICLL